MYGAANTGSWLAHTHTHDLDLEVRYPLDSRCTED